MHQQEVVRNGHCQQWVILRPEPPGQFTAQVVGLPEIHAVAPTREEAVGRVRAALGDWLASGRLIPVELSSENPWVELPGHTEPNDPCELIHPEGLARSRELAKWIGRLESLSTLTPGWNRQGAPPPSEEAIRTARQFIVVSVNDGQPPTRVAASAVGGVGVTRQAGERMAYVEFYNEGAACALLADDSTDEQVLDVAPEGGTFRRFLDKVKTYLNG
jgi:hypothetical protein